jgi:hypothetical protein
MAEASTSKDTVNVNREEYDQMRDRIRDLEEADTGSPIAGAFNKPVSKNGWLWIAPEYFSRWRLAYMLIALAVIITNQWWYTNSVVVGTRSQQSERNKFTFLIFLMYNY